MKKIPSSFTAVALFVLCTLIFTTQAFAQSADGSAGMRSSSSATPHRDGTSERKFEKEPEQLRSDLLNFVQAYKELAATMGMKKEGEAFERAADQLRQLPLEQLDALRNVLPDTSGMNAATQKLHDQVEKLRLTNPESSSFQMKVIGDPQSSIGFPGAEYPSCGSTRQSEAVIDAADIALFAAETVRDIASRGCDQVVVAAGFGGNPSLVCLTVDAIYLTAKTVNYGLHFCDDKISEAELAATYGRLGHIHEDVESSVANDNANTTAITGAVATATSTITANDNANKTAIVINDNANTTNIIANANANKGDVIVNANSNTTTITTAISNAQTTIVNNDNANKNTIIANDNANKNELRDLILRTQIEADLAQTEGSTPVAIYFTPTANGGYLNLVRTIVAQTIANIQAAGGSAGQAQSWLTQGDAAKAAGDFKGAYTLYRKAYKFAAK